jgi:hypothetical protein
MKDVGKLEYVTKRVTVNEMMELVEYISCVKKGQG